MSGRATADLIGRAENLDDRDHQSLMLVDDLKPRFPDFVFDQRRQLDRLGYRWATR
jgi:hypothetical protein